MFRSVVSLTLAVALAGCAGLNLKRSVAEEDLNKTRRVGVVSILGDTFHGIFIGTTAFNNESFSASVSDWSVDKYASATALSMLRFNSRFQSAELDRANFTPEQIRADGGKVLWEAAEKQGYDKLVIVRPGVSDNYPFFRPGFGLFERSFFGNGKRCIYAAYVVDVYDVASRRPVAWEWGGSMPCAMGSDANFPFRKQFSEYSVEDQQAMRHRLETRLTESLRYALGNLSLLTSSTSGK